MSHRSTLWRTPRTIVLGLFVIGALLLQAGPATGAPKGPLNPPEPWEPLVEEGIRTQDRERKATSAAQLVNQYRRRSSRAGQGPDGVRDWYLYARSMGLYFGHVTQQATRTKDLSRRAMLQREAAQAYRDAMEAYRETLSRAPNCYYAYHDMGVIALQREGEDRTQAVRWLLQATQIHTRYPDPYRKLTLVYRQTEQWDAMTTALRRLLAIEPQELVARESLAVAYAKLGRFPEARREAQELQRLDSDEPQWKLLAAQLDLEEGLLDKAQKAFRALVRAYPAKTAPLQGYMQCLEAKRAQGQTVELEELRWGLSQLLRLDRADTPAAEARRAKLREQLKAIREAIRQKSMPAAEGTEGGQPTAEQLVQLLERGTDDQRWKVISFLHAVDGAPPGALLRGVLGRLGHTREPQARVRMKAVEIAGRAMGYAWIAVLRLIPEQDPSPEVRLAALNAIVDVAAANSSGKAAGILALERFLASDDRAMAAAARVGILRLGDGRLGDEGQGTDRAHREAFERWWTGTDGRIVRIEALGAVHKLRDPRAEALVLPSFRHPDFFIRRAAYQAFGKILQDVQSPDGERWYRTKRPDLANWVRWLRARPAMDADGYTEAAEARLRGTLDQWAASRPK